MAQRQRQAFLLVETMEPRQLLSGAAISAPRTDPCPDDVPVRSTLTGVEKPSGPWQGLRVSSSSTPASRRSRPDFRSGKNSSQWTADQSAYSASTLGSGLAMQQQMLSDTVAFVKNGVSDDQFEVIVPLVQASLQRLRSRLSMFLYINPTNAGNTPYNFAIVKVTYNSSKNSEGSLKRHGPSHIHSKAQFSDYI